MPSANKQLLIIVGPGCFGVSTALAFLREGGWSMRAIERAIEQPAVDAASTDLNKVLPAGDCVTALGGKIEWGKEVADLFVEGNEVKGVRLVDGEVLTADLVIVTTGSWPVSRKVAFERRPPSGMPIVRDFVTGSYSFSPTPGSEAEGGGIVKTAIRHLGCVDPDLERNGASVPRTF